MSLTSIINIAKSGVLAHQTAIAATAENVANIATPDFARRDVQFQADQIPGQFSGVSVSVVREASDAALQAASLSSASDVAGLERVADALSRVLDSLGATDDNVSFADRAAQAVNGFAQLNASPQSAAAQANALSTLQSAFAAFDETRAVIDTEVQRAQSGLQSGVDSANTILQEIATLNARIASDPDGSGGPADALSAQLAALSTLLPINVSRDDIGRASVVTQSGRVLVDAGGAGQLSASADGALSLTPSAGGDPIDISAEITGGDIGGSLQLVNGDLAAVRDLINQAEAGFANALNAAAAANTAFPPPAILSGTQALTAAGLSRLEGQTSIALVNSAGALSAQIVIDFTNGTLSRDGGPAIAFGDDPASLVDGLNAALGGQGTASLVDGQLVLDGGALGGVAIADDGAGFGALAGFNPLLVSDGEGFAVNPDILANPSTIPSARLSLEGVTLGASVLLANNGAGAAALFEAGRGEAEQLAQTLGTIGAAANASRARADSAAAFADDIAARLASESGVNLEEELTNLILFQRSFNANARILAVADELYQSILALI